MRLVTTVTSKGSAAAVVCNGDAVPVAPSEYADVGALLRDGAAGIDRARHVAEGDARGVPVVPGSLLRPVLEPGATFCVGLNYRSHFEELGRDLPAAPVWFSKLARSLAHPDADLPVALLSREMDYEAEVAIVIGRMARDVARSDAWDVVAGLTLLNDITARDLQRERVQVFAGKNLERSTPVGPCVVTLDELGDVASLELTATVNGEHRQRGRLDDLVFDVPALIADLSRLTTLQPGDLVATGTPGGVGVAASPPRYLGASDVVEVSAPWAGSLVNRIVGGPRHG